MENKNVHDSQIIKYQLLLAIAENWQLTLIVSHLFLAFKVVVVVKDWPVDKHLTIKTFCTSI